MKKEDKYLINESPEGLTELNPAWLSWGLFKESGNPGYYLLYKSITEENNEEK